MSEEKANLQGTLMKILKDNKDGKGNDMYAHLQKVLVYIALNDPKSALDKFEEISYEIRTKEKFDPPELFLDYRKLALASQAWTQLMRDSYFEVKKAVGEDAGEALSEPGPLCYVPDLLTDNKILEWAGLGFGEEESYLLMKSMKKLAQKGERKSLKLWGKIYGTAKDYYIIEEDKEGGGAELPPEVEPRGSGVNRFGYWVTDSVTGEWVELPDVTPQMIQMARKIKRIFTGVLDADVISNPFFFGKEKDLLRAQIARITQTTSLHQFGAFKKAEESEREIVEVTEEGERKVLTFEQLTQLDSWVHYSPNILKCGRTAHLQPEPPKEEPPDYDPAKALKDLEIDDPYEPRLKPLSEDSPQGDWPTSWTIKVTGDAQTYKEEGKKVPTNNGIIVLKSLVWPGAYVLYQNDRWFNFYV